MKKVLIMCTGNSCRSIIGEALINAQLRGVQAQSCGITPSKKVNPNAKKILQENNIWDEKYYSKHLDEVKYDDFDLLVTVCSHADEACPVFPKPINKIHVGFDDPDAKGYNAFKDTYKEIEKVLLEEVKKALF